MFVVTYLVPAVPYPRSIAVLGGVWAMVPDVHWVAPVYAAEPKAAHGSVLADLFWFHRTLDRLDPTDSKAVAAVLLALLFAVTFVAERRGYRPLERVRELGQ